MRHSKSGFTLIELLIVVVIIGILAAIAIPKFESTKDKSKMASIRTDIRNYMTAEEGYLADNSTYTDAATIATSTNYTPSSGNSVLASAGNSTGYSIQIQNVTIVSATKTCHVGVGSAASSSTVDGVIVCP